MIPFNTEIIAKDEAPQRTSVPSEDSFIDQLVYGTPGQFDRPLGFEGVYHTIRGSDLQNLHELPSHIGNAPYQNVIIRYER